MEQGNPISVHEWAISRTKQSNNKWWDVNGQEYVIFMYIDHTQM